MIRDIMKDPLFLSRISEQATETDAAIGNDLLQTLIAHKEECVGMAATLL